MADSSSKHREHNQGNQSRTYTPEQKSAVDRVRRCKATDYYAILDIEKTVTENEIKKAYRRLALVMHPDKNGAPGADEAFKLVSKAFQVLSDTDKRSHYDKFGGDPDSRGGGGGPGPSGFSGGSPFRGGGFPGGGGHEMTPEELFNAFFGGGPFGGAFGGPAEFVTFGGPFGFGGPGIRVQTFGGGPRMRRRPGPGGGATEETRQETQAEHDASLRATLIQLAPLLFLFLLPVLMSLWSDWFGAGGTGGFNSGIPDVRFEPVSPYTHVRSTPNHHIRYYVDEAELARKQLTDRQLRNMDLRVEARYIAALQQECRREALRREEEMEAARGWFFEDRERMERARNMRMPACGKLRELGEGGRMGER